jgi:hypothetical protein
VNPQHMVAALQTITPNHRDFRRISLVTPYPLFYQSYDFTNPTNFKRDVGEAYCVEWLELDQLLAQIWESRSIRPQLIYDVPQELDRESVRSCMEALLPEVMTRGVVELVGWE